MAQEYGPNIVTDGLVLCLDAADKNSYPGSGTTWYDLSGNGNDGTLTNGPTFSSDKGGTIVLDGSDDKIVVANAPNISPTPHMSEFVWVRFDDASQLSGIASKWQGGSNASWFTYRHTDRTVRVGVSSDGADGGGTRTDLSTTDTVADAVWAYVGITVDSANLKIYINGAESISTSHSNGIFDGTDDLDIGRAGNDSYACKGQISGVKIYNRALSAKEVSQNFNAQRSRFGI